MLYAMKSIIRTKKKVTFLFWTQVYMQTFNFKSIGLLYISIYRNKDGNNLISPECVFIIINFCSLPISFP